MPPKRKISSDANDKKKRRKVITLETKCNIITDNESGISLKDLVAKYMLSTSTVNSILKDKEKYLEQVKNAHWLQSTWVRSKQNESLIPRMEKLLTDWVIDQTEVHAPVTYATVRAKALSIFNALKQEKGGCEERFSASSGWFDRYKRRSGWHSNKVLAEYTNTNNDEARLFSRMLAGMLKEGNYSPSQVFNVDETELYWKRMPPCSSTVKEESSTIFRASRDRLTLLLGGNAAGDCKLKPMMVHRVQNPRALRGIVKSSLPVIWRGNKRSLVTASIFEDWFSQYFVPRVTKYCEDKSIPFRVILLLDSAPCHPLSLQHHHSNVKIMFLPPNVASSLQPMGQGVTAIFKTLYLRYTFEMLLKLNGNRASPTVQEFWNESFGILNAIKIAARAWNDITAISMRGAWKKLGPRFSFNMEGLEEPGEIICRSIQAIVSLANELNLNVSASDVNDLLEAHDEELMDEDILVMEEPEEDEDEEDIENETPVRSFTLEALDEAFRHIERASEIFESQDSNFERATKIGEELRNACECYREIYEEKKRLIGQRTLLLQRDAAGSSNETKISEAQSSIDSEPFNELRIFVDCVVKRSLSTESLDIEENNS
ncbi:tigger transposable element-derived protein 1-like [Hylaeus volcanicus]|uniref:tigger transposable element-derived protein 1-like n=1 Tax=Hylaeus volcanicus TaxID=313075 RepID=UPI0023B7D6DC|nr:tigger transposable element-derived protein 1-like [Hylaeus volcanicus]